MRYFAPALIVAALAACASAAPVVNDEHLSAAGSAGSVSGFLGAHAVGADEHLIQGRAVTAGTVNPGASLGARAQPGLISAFEDAQPEFVWAIADIMRSAAAQIKDVNHGRAVDAGTVNLGASLAARAEPGFVSAFEDVGPEFVSAIADIMRSAAAQIKDVNHGRAVAAGTVNLGASLGARARPEFISTSLEIAKEVNAEIKDALQGRAVAAGSSVKGDVGAVGASLDARESILDDIANRLDPGARPEFMSALSQIASQINREIKDALQGRAFNDA